MKEWMKQETTVNGWDFEYVENDYDDRFFQCRGEVMYDDEHDEMPEPSLWSSLRTRKTVNKSRSQM